MKNKGRVHLNQYLTPSAPFLALCGDIGNPSRPAYKEFLRQCSAAFERVFVIPGNHEYYNFDQKGSVMYTMDEKNAQMRAICSEFPNVVWLQEQCVELVEGVNICGAALWTQIDVENEAEAKETMNDYNTIRASGGVEFTPQDERMEHRRQRGMLQYYIEEARSTGKKLVVLTHHLPSFSWIHPDFKRSKLNYCYASDMDSMICDPVIGWLCGHTHRCMTRFENGVYCGINPKGYPFERGANGKKDAVFEWNPSEDTIFV